MPLFLLPDTAACPSLHTLVPRHSIPLPPVPPLSALVELKGPERQQALDAFYTRWQADPLVVLKWLGLQAMSNAPGNVQLVKSLVDHPAFNINNPNNCYSLFLGGGRGR